MLKCTISEVLNKYEFPTNIINVKVCKYGCMFATFSELTEEESYSFKIVYHCEGGRTYYLCTNSQASMEAWMKALACASYDYMKLMVSELQRQLDEAEAEEACEAAGLVTIAGPEDEPKVPPRGQRYNPFNKTADSECKTVHGSRHHKENVKPESLRKKVSFRDIHKSYGRQILLDRSAWRARVARPLIQL